MGMRQTCTLAVPFINNYKSDYTFYSWNFFIAFNVISIFLFHKFIFILQFFCIIRFIEKPAVVNPVMNVMYIDNK